MALVVAITQAQFVAWTCFAVGIILVVGGVLIGLWTSLRRAPQKAEDAQTKLNEAKAKLDEARGNIERTTAAVASPGLEGVDAAADATLAVEAAGASTEEAKSALQQVQGIVAALPENLRFAGLLVLVGTVLMSVATVQFGGVSLF